MWYREQFRSRLSILRRLGEILDLLMSEVRYSRSTLPECCRHVAERTGEPFQSCLGEIYEEMRCNSGICFGEVFAEKMGRCLEGVPLTSQDRDIFLRFAAQSGFAEGDMQIQWMALSREQLARRVELLESELAGRSRIALSLGVMSGLLLVILLL
ncbi:MAG: stage III sporulation protein AB [Candidatus Gastranaerophilales bacterium]|nr:stage III sporulation protein AB [Candidatus Gastranaerophilales bacterium]